MGGENKSLQTITNGGLKGPKGWEDSDTGFKIQIENYENKTIKNCPNPAFWFFCQNGDQMIFDLNFKASVGILSSFCIF